MDKGTLRRSRCRRSWSTSNRHGRRRHHYHPYGSRRTSRGGRSTEGAGRIHGLAGRRWTSSQRSRACGLLPVPRGRHHPAPSASPTRPRRHRTYTHAARGCLDRACRRSSPRRTPPQARWQPRRRHWPPSPRSDPAGSLRTSKGRSEHAEREKEGVRGREREKDSERGKGRGKGSEFVMDV